MASPSPPHKQSPPIPGVTDVEETQTSPPPLKLHPPTLLSYSSLPEWRQDNPFIHYSYRPESNSARASLASWLYMHNETVNIYTHLLPALLFLVGEALIYQYFRASYPDATIGDRLVFAFFLLTAATCLGVSAAFHTLLNHSVHVLHLWLRLDFVGIVVLTLGDFVSGIYMVFYCEAMLRWIYWGMILALGTATVILLLTPKFQGRRWLTLRVVAFVGTGLSGLAPLAHGVRVFGWAQMLRQSGMAYYLGEGVLLILGVLFYTMRVPESFKPGGFDIFGSSHQIFHVLVVGATVVHLVGIASAFDYNYHHRKCGGVA